MIVRTYIRTELAEALEVHPELVDELRLRLAERVARWQDEELRRVLREHVEGLPTATIPGGIFG